MSPVSTAWGETERSQLVGESAGIWKCRGEICGLETTNLALESTPSPSWFGFFVFSLFFISFKAKYRATLLAFLSAPASPLLPKSPVEGPSQSAQLLRLMLSIIWRCSSPPFTHLLGSWCSLPLPYCYPPALTSSATSRCHLFKRRK